MVFDPSAYLSKLGWTAGEGLGKNSQGDARALRLSKKDDLQGIGHVEDWSNQLGRFAAVFEKSMSTMNIVIASDSDDSDGEEAAAAVAAVADNSRAGKKQRKQEKKEIKSSKKEKRAAAAAAATAAADDNSSRVVLGFGLGALGYAKKPTDHSTMHLGFQAATHKNSNSTNDINNDSIPITDRYRSHGDSNKQHEQQLQSTIMSKLTTGSVTISTTAGSGYITAAQPAVFDNRSHLYWGRAESKLRRLHEQDLQAAAIVAAHGQQQAAPAAAVAAATAVTAAMSLIAANVEKALAVSASRKRERAEQDAAAATATTATEQISKAERKAAKQIKRERKEQKASKKASKKQKK